MGRPTAHGVAFALLAGAVAYLATKNLDSAWFWDDEAEVAVFARNWANRGELSGWDGRNMFAFRNGTTTDAELHTRQPPLMFGVAALAFKMLGATTFTGRLPFVFCGLLAWVLFGRLLRRLFADQPTVVAYGLLCMGLSVTFLLSIRQCRYYALCLLFAVLTYDAYERIARAGASGWRVLGLATSAALFFYSHYLIAALFLAALGVTHVAMGGLRWGLRRHVPLAVTAALFLLMTVPYAVAETIWNRADLPTPTRPWYVGRPLLVLQYLRDLNVINVLPFVGLLAMCFLARGYTKGRRPAAILMVLAVVNCILVGWFTPQPFHAKEPADVRYLMASLPFAAGAMGWTLAALHARSRWMAMAALVISVGTNGFSIQPELKYTWLLPAYLWEIHHPYPTASQRAAEAVREVAGPNDTVMTIPDFESLPLLFYVGDDARICCQISSNSPLARTPQRLNAPWMFIDRNFPRWVVTYGPEPMVGPLLNFLQRPHDDATGFRQYRYVLEKRLGVYYRNIQRSELMFHGFGPEPTYDSEREDVYLMRRTD